MKRPGIIVVIIVALSFICLNFAFAGKDCSSPTATAIKDYAVSLYKNGEYKDAAHEFKKCLMVEPECSACSEYLAKINRIPQAVEGALDRREKMPVAVLEKQTLDECKTFIFDGTKSYDPDGKIVSYAWDFGDGKRASGEQVTHTYARTGKYTVTLTVTDDSGLECNKATVTEELEVAGAPA
ncbi:MAG: PKD domain-containing protein, partial [Candidatus Omnitrophica bacterium]|nr:PKD domain-containing protein [Candidatus Omnitrophota bacterium]